MCLSTENTFEMRKHGDDEKSGTLDRDRQQQSTKRGQVNSQPGYCLVGILPVNKVFLNAIFPE
jgi:hypothetical protein